MKLSHVLLVVVAAMLVIAPAAMAADGEKKVKMVTVTGELTKVEAAAITITITVAVKKGEAKVAEEKTIPFDKDMKIMIESAENEPVPGEGDKIKEKAKIIEGSPNDLKVGKRVMVGFTEDGKAIKILVLREKPKGEGKEGKERPPTPRKPGGDRK